MPASQSVITAAAPVAGEDQARADLYRLLAAVLQAPPGDAMLAALAAVQGDASPIGAAVAAMADRAGGVCSDTVEQEFTALFIGLGRGELVPYGSYYLTGFLQEKPLAALRVELRALGIAVDAERAEPEDHIATVLEVMAGLIAGDYGDPTGLDAQRRFFRQHIGPWAGRFFVDLERAEAADFYRPVGTLGRLLIDIDGQAFTMT